MAYQGTKFDNSPRRWVHNPFDITLDDGTIVKGDANGRIVIQQGNEVEYDEVNLSAKSIFFIGETLRNTRKSVPITREEMKVFQEKDNE